MYHISYTKHLRYSVDARLSNLSGRTKVIILSLGNFLSLLSIFDFVAEGFYFIS